MTKEIVIASGKGGTGKTFIASNLAYYIRHNVSSNVLCVDADVEAPDLIIALGGIKSIELKNPFKGAKVPIVNHSLCNLCGKCLEVCRYNALKIENDRIVVDYEKCEGFGACAIFCPNKAISLQEKEIGDIIIAKSKEDIIVITGDLYVGYGNSGRLVYEIKRIAREYSLKQAYEYIIVDAAAGIGCPIISSIVDADLLIIVIEPTLQSMKGAKRLRTIAKSLNLDYVAIINKYDLNYDFTKEIEKEFHVIGKIPYDENVIIAYTSMCPILKLNSNSKASKSLLSTFKELEKVIS